MGIISAVSRIIPFFMAAEKGKMPIFAGKILNMKINNSSRSNMRFLFGSVFFFAVLILTIMLFVYYAMGQASKKVSSKMFVYNIYVSGAPDGEDCTVLLDDSLIFSSPAVTADTMLSVNRYFVSDTVVENGRRTVRETAYFTEESVLRVVGGASDDTLSMKVGNNSNIKVSVNAGRVETQLTE